MVFMSFLFFFLMGEGIDFSRLLFFGIMIWVSIGYKITQTTWDEIELKILK